MSERVIELHGDRCCCFLSSYTILMDDVTKLHRHSHLENYLHSCDWRILLPAGAPIPCFHVKIAFIKYYQKGKNWPVTMALLSERRTLFARSTTEIRSSNPALSKVVSYLRFVLYRQRPCKGPIRHLRVPPNF